MADDSENQAEIKAVVPPASPLLLGAFEGRQAFLSVLAAAIVEHARPDGCREMFWMDASFSDWPLSDASVLAALRGWAKPGRRLHLLAQQFDEVSRRHPRFVQWRGRYGHCVTAHACDVDAWPQGHSAPAAMFLAEGADLTLSVSLRDTIRWRGVIAADRVSAHHLRVKFDASLQRSYESFAATTLGL
ncbi:hypothetical protein [Roseateles koreensis]|uniref:Uncharacterized protein n=1 Tax=Roseateles koreensis TaxID=2987526 RepID=A0ABT5KU68_9BURK|nr:hypothetical protein [Roseateles koreensis]MDC8785980.1 hypothetical protein [Roseateles koreensis]